MAKAYLLKMTLHIQAISKMEKCMEKVNFDALKKILMIVIPTQEILKTTNMKDKDKSYGNLAKFIKVHLKMEKCMEKVESLCGLMENTM